MKTTLSLFGKKIESPNDLFQAMDRDGDGILAYDEVRGGASLYFFFFVVESLATHERITDARFLFLLLFSFFSFFFFLSSSLVNPTHCQHSIDLALT
jgi:hypothetical protein